MPRLYAIFVDGQFQEDMPELMFTSRAAARCTLRYLKQVEKYERRGHTFTAVKLVQARIGRIS